MLGPCRLQEHAVKIEEIRVASTTKSSLLIDKRLQIMKGKHIAITDWQSNCSISKSRQRTVIGTSIVPRTNKLRDEQK
jgi:hypothetical protein